MTIEILSPTYLQVIGQLHTISKYYIDCTTAKTFTTRSQFITAGRETLHKTEMFLQHHKATISKGGAGTDSARAAGKFASLSKKIATLIKDIENGLNNQQISSITALRKTTMPNVYAIIKDYTEHLKKFLPVNFDENELTSLAKTMEKNGDKVTARLLLDAAKRAASGEKPESAEEIMQRQIDSEAAHHLSDYKKLSSKLPNSLKGKLFSLVNLPVVPYMDFSLMSPKFLRTSGLDYTPIADSFVVFNNQYLLAFDYIAATTAEGVERKSVGAVTFKNTRVAKTDSKGNPLTDENGKVLYDKKQVANKNTLASRKRTAEHRSLQEEFVLRVLESLNAKSSEEYTLMSSHFEHHPTNGKIAFAWIVPKRIQKIFARNGDLSNAEWGFPWNSKSTSVL